MQFQQYPKNFSTEEGIKLLNNVENSALISVNYIENGKDVSRLIVQNTDYDKNWLIRRFVDLPVQHAVTISNSKVSGIYVVDTYITRDRAVEMIQSTSDTYDVILQNYSTVYIKNRQDAINTLNSAQKKDTFNLFIKDREKLVLVAHYKILSLYDTGQYKLYQTIQKKNETLQEEKKHFQLNKMSSKPILLSREDGVKLLNAAEENAQISIVYSSKGKRIEQRIQQNTDYDREWLSLRFSYLKLIYDRLIITNSKYAGSYFIVPYVSRARAIEVVNSTSSQYSIIFNGIPNLTTQDITNRINDETTADPIYLSITIPDVDPQYTGKEIDKYIVFKTVPHPLNFTTNQYALQRRNESDTKSTRNTCYDECDNSKPALATVIGPVGNYVQYMGKTYANPFVLRRMNDVPLAKK